MDLIRNRYNPQAFYDVATKILDNVSKEEAIGWYNHPCTQSLLNSLEGDIAGIVVMWLGGGYSSEESSAETSQRQAKARGMAQAMNDIIEHINDVKNLNLDGDSFSE